MSKRAATLAVKFPQGTALTGLHAFSSLTGGQDLHLKLSRKYERQIVVPVLHFSEQGLLEAKAEDIATELELDFAPSSAGSAALGRISNELSKANPDNHRISLKLFSWYAHGIRPLVQRAAGDDGYLNPAVREYMQCFTIVKLLTQVDLLSAGQLRTLIALDLQALE